MKRLEWSKEEKGIEYKASSWYSSVSGGFHVHLCKQQNNCPIQAAPEFSVSSPDRKSGLL